MSRKHVRLQPRPAPRKRATVDDDALISAILQLHGTDKRGHFQPCVGWLYASGDVRRYHPEAEWLNLHRAISSCFGSVAKRMRGTWDADFHQLGDPVTAILMVLNERGDVVWKHRIDIPDEMGTR